MRRGSWTVFLAVCLPAVAHGDALTVDCRVLTDAGRPVAGAEVYIVSRLMHEGARGHTRADGHCRLALDAPETNWVRVVALAPGLAVGGGLVRADAPDELVIRLAEGASVRGRVVGPDGKPVAEADVRLRSVWLPSKDEDRPEIVFLGQDSPVRAASGADSRFVIGQVPRGARAGLMATAQGYALWMADHDGPVGGAEEEFVVRLAPAAVIKGIVSHEGRPVPDLRVFAQGTDLNDGWGETRTDPEGRYRLEHLSAGQYNVMLEPPPELTATAHANLSVQAGKTLSAIDFALTPGGVIEGRVLDARSAKGIAGARVASYGPHRPRSGAACWSVQTDATGAYQMRVPAGQSYLYYMGGLEEYPYEDGAHFEIQVAEGQTVHAPELKLTRAEPIGVRVTDPNGHPVAGAKLVSPSTHSSREPSDAEGRLRLAGVRAGEAMLLVAVDPSSRRGAAVVKDAQPTTPVPLTVAQPAEVVWRFIDQTGRPQAGVPVSASADVNFGQGPGGPARAGYLHVLASTESDADGIVRLGPLPAGVPLQFGSGRALASDRDWRPECPVPEPGRTYNLGDVEIEATTIRVAGVVLLPDQTPAPGVTVRANVVGVEPAHTDVQGRFVLSGVTALGPVLIAATSADGKLVGSDTVGPEWDYEPQLLLGEPLSAEGQVIDGDGAPQAGRRVLVRPQAAGGWIEGLPLRAEARTDANGRFTIGGLLPGLTYQVLAYSADERGIAPLASFTGAAGELVQLGALEYRPPAEAALPAVLGAGALLGLVAGVWVRRCRAR